MKRVLVYVPGSSVDLFEAWDCSTPKKNDEAFLGLFRLLESIGTYKYGELSVAEQQMHDLAKHGNEKFAQALCLLRKEKPGEEFVVLNIENPWPEDTRPVKKIEPFFVDEFIDKE